MRALNIAIAKLGQVGPQECDQQGLHRCRNVANNVVNNVSEESRVEHAGVSQCQLTI